MHILILGLIAADYCSVEGSVRLADGDSVNEGRIEYCYNNEWAPMCTLSSTNVKIGDLICKKLGYSKLNYYIYISQDQSDCHADGKT